MENTQIPVWLSFVCMKDFIEEYMNLYCPESEDVGDMLSYLGSSDFDNYLPPDPALWSMWTKIINENAEKHHRQIS